MLDYITNNSHGNSRIRNRNSNALSLDWPRMELIAIRSVSSQAANTTVVNTLGIGRHYKVRLERKYGKKDVTQVTINFVFDFNFYQIF